LIQYFNYIFRGSYDGFKPHSKTSYLGFDFENSAFATSKLVQVLGSINDADSYSTVTKSNFDSIVIGLNLCQLSIIGYWVSGILFHISWSGNYLVWLSNPLNCIPISHSIYDFHSGSYFLGAFSSFQGNFSVALSYSGVYNILYTLGVSSISSLFSTTLCIQIVSLLFLVVSICQLNSGSMLYLSSTKLHISPTSSYYSNLSSSLFGSIGLRLSYHLSSFLGLGSILWSGHIVHCSIPVSRGSYPSIFIPEFPLYHLFKFDWCFYASNPDSSYHIFGSSLGSGTSLLSSSCRLSPLTGSIPLTDIAHHHLAIGVLLILFSIFSTS